MEQSKNKRANNMLRVVSLLCIILILAITVFTFTSKKEDKVNEDTIKVSESRSESEKETKIVSSESQSESKSGLKDEETNEGLKKETVSQKEDDKKAKEDTKSAAVVQKQMFELPVVGAISKSYSVDIPVYSLTMNDYRAHTGIDIACEQGSAVSACEAGVIKDISFDPLMGHTVTVEHSNGICSSYMNLGENLPEDVTVGASVSKGQLIGAVGNSAMIEIANEPHLHFEMTVAGAYVDPLTMLDQGSISVMSENIVD